MTTDHVTVRGIECPVVKDNPYDSIDLRKLGILEETLPPELNEYPNVRKFLIQHDNVLEFLKKARAKLPARATVEIFEERDEKGSKYFTKTCQVDVDGDQMISLDVRHNATVQESILPQLRDIPDIQRLIIQHNNVLEFLNKDYPALPARLTVEIYEECDKSVPGCVGKGKKYFTKTCQVEIDEHKMLSLDICYKILTKVQFTFKAQEKLFQLILRGKEHLHLNTVGTFSGLEEVVILHEGVPGYKALHICPELGPSWLEVFSLKGFTVSERITHFDPDKPGLNECNLDFLNNAPNVKKMFLNHKSKPVLTKPISHVSKVEELFVFNCKVENLLSQFQMSDMKNLVLHRCGLHVFPHEINQAKELVALAISEDNFINQSTDLNSLSKLKYLSLVQCNLNKCPESLNKLNELEYLNLLGNEFHDEKMDLSSSTKLKKLNLRDCKLTKCPDGLHKLQQLEEMDLSINRLNDSLKTMSAIPSLKRLVVRHCRITALPQELSKMTSLEDLDLASNNFEQYGQGSNRGDVTNLDQIGYLTELRDLNLSSCRLRKIPQQIFALPKIDHIDVSDNQVKELPDTVTKMLKRGGRTIVRGNHLEKPPQFLVGDLDERDSSSRILEYFEGDSELYSYGKDTSRASRWFSDAYGIPIFPFYGGGHVRHEKEYSGARKRLRYRGGYETTQDFIRSSTGGSLETENATLNIGPGVLSKNTRITMAQCYAYYPFKDVVSSGLVEEWPVVLGFLPEDVKFQKTGANLSVRLGHDYDPSLKLFVLRGVYNSEKERVVWTAQGQEVKRKGRSVNIVVRSFSYRAVVNTAGPLSRILRALNGEEEELGKPMSKVSTQVHRYLGAAVTGTSSAITQVQSYTDKVKGEESEEVRTEKGEGKRKGKLVKGEKEPGKEDFEEEVNALVRDMRTDVLQDIANYVDQVGESEIQKLVELVGRDRAWIKDLLYDRTGAQSVMQILQSWAREETPTVMELAEILEGMGRDDALSLIYERYPSLCPVQEEEREKETKEKGMRKEEAEIKGKPIIVTESSGGALKTRDAILLVGPGSVSKDTKLTMVQHEEYSAFKSIVERGLLQRYPLVLEFLPDGLKFLNGGAELTVEFDDDGTLEHLSVLYGFYDSEKKSVTWKVYDDRTTVKGNSVTITIHGFSWFSFIRPFCPSFILRIIACLNQTYNCYATALYRKAHPKVAVVLSSKFVTDTPDELKRLTNENKHENPNPYKIAERGPLKPISLANQHKVRLLPGAQDFAILVDENLLDGEGDVHRNFVPQGLDIEQIEIRECNSNNLNKLIWTLNIPQLPRATSSATTTIPGGAGAGISGGITPVPSSTGNGGAGAGISGGITPVPSSTGNGGAGAGTSTGTTQVLSYTGNEHKRLANKRDCDFSTTTELKRPRMGSDPSTSAELVRDMSLTLRGKVADLLDIRDEACCNDARKLAEKLGMGKAEIDALWYGRGQCSGPSPTGEVLNWWKRKENATVMRLVAILKEMEREDVLSAIGDEYPYLHPGNGQMQQ